MPTKLANVSSAEKDATFVYMLRRRRVHLHMDERLVTVTARHGNINGFILD